ncbi:MAG: hypothetical protein EAZ79_28865 [Oscillatoriales cyanobacterium]|nr:MAG: hypothetical protein EAZ79_28865 [Oscillatoriales cyanobacterium]
MRAFLNEELNAITSRLAEAMLDRGAKKLKIPKPIQKTVAPRRLRGVLAETGRRSRPETRLMAT